MNNQLSAFFIEIWHRIGTKSPKFFKVLQLFGASLTFAGYVPSMLQRWFGVEVPGHTITMCEDIGKYAAGFFASTILAAKTPVVGKTVEGTVVRVTNEKKMPFSSAAEKKEIEKTIPPPEVLPEVPEANHDGTT